MTSRHATLRNDKFYPFDWISGDFDLKAFSKRMRLRPLQRELFKELMKQYELTIWFWEKDDDDKDDRRRDSPGLELLCFMPCHADCVSVHISSANLLEMLEGALLDDSEFLEYEQEIVAIEKLSALCNRAIELRRQKINERDAMPTTETVGPTP
jgi:hypothetical protein